MFDSDSDEDKFNRDFNNHDNDDSDDDDISDKDMAIAIIIFGTIAIIALFVSFSVLGYNDITSQVQDIQKDESQVQTVLQQRGDTVPEMVDSVKGDQRQEHRITNRITDARTQYYNAQSKFSHAKSSQARENALNDQAHSFGLMVGGIQEDYPNLKSSDRVKQLMTTINSTNADLAKRRQGLNYRIEKYDARIAKFPDKMFSGMLGFHHIKYFSGSDASQSAPKIRF